MEDLQWITTLKECVMVAFFLIFSLMLIWVVKNPGLEKIGLLPLGDGIEGEREAPPLRGSAGGVMEVMQS